MKKGFCALAALALALSLGVCVFGEGLLPPVPGDWADPACPEVRAELYPAWVHGTAYTDGLALDLHWQAEGGGWTDYRMILAPAGKDGAFSVWHCEGVPLRIFPAQSGGEEKEGWENRAVRGEAVFSVDGEGRMTLRISDTPVPELNGLVLGPVEVPPPGAEEIGERVLSLLLAPEEGSAGSGLKRARAAAELLGFAAEKRLYAVDPAALGEAMNAALEARAAEITPAFAAAAREAAALMRTLAGMGGAEEAEYAFVRGRFEDAGVMDEAAAALETGPDCFSAAVLADCLDALAE